MATRPMPDPESPAPRLRVLLEYSASPVTTGRYIERALRQDHEVVTAGLRVPEDLLYFWLFSEPAPPYPPHDIDLPHRTTYARLLQGLPKGFDPDLFLYVDSGREGVPDDICRLDVPKVCYLIDTHIAPEPRLEIARHFDFVFLAQRAQIPLFERAGIKNVHWLPLACSPELHGGLAAVERTLDVAWVGRCLDDPDDRRRRLVEEVCERFPKSVRAQVYPEAMADLYNRAKIVVNVAVKKDLNMRVFEAMASGALLIADEADGLEDLFSDREHLVVYRKDEDLAPLVRQYLEDDAERTRIARAGQALVLERHTYRARMQAMLAHVVNTLGERSIVSMPGGISGESRYHQGGYFRNERRELAAQVPETARRVLDVGCGGGDFGAALKRRGAQEVVGVEIVERVHALAKQVLDDALLGNIEHMELPFEDGYFDCIVLGDVLEHLVEPGATLRKLARVLAPDGTIVASIPNVRFCQVVSMLAHGRWQYADAGILDRTHLRFFTRTEMIELFEGAGLKVAGIGPLSVLTPTQLERDARGFIHMDKMTYGPVDDAEYRDFLTYQYLLKAVKPHTDPLLAARRAFDAGDFQRALDEAVRAEGADGAARSLLLGKAHAALGYNEAAEKAFRDALALLPEEPEALRGLALSLAALNRADEAQTFADRALQALPDDPRLLALSAQTALSGGDAAGAFERLCASLNENIEQEEALYECARLGAELGRLDEMAALFRRYVDLYPAKPGPAAAYVRILLALEDADEAAKRLDTLQMFFPDNPEVKALIEEADGAHDETGG